MTGINVLVVPPTSAGRLFPRYDHEADILIAESRVERPWPYGLDVDGSIVFDLDADRTLANVDVHIPMSRWITSTWQTPVATQREGDLVFTPETVAAKSFTGPVRITSNTVARMIRIDFDLRAVDCSVVLSADCIAHLSGGTLVGFSLFGVP